MGRMGCAEAVGPCRWLCAPDSRRHAQAGAASGSSQSAPAPEPRMIKPRFVQSGRCRCGGACGGRGWRCRAARPRARYAGPQNHGMPCGGADGIRAAHESHDLKRMSTNRLFLDSGDPASDTRACCSVTSSRALEITPTPSAWSEFPSSSSKIPSSEESSLIRFFWRLLGASLKESSESDIVFLRLLLGISLPIILANSSLGICRFPTFFSEPRNFLPELRFFFSATEH